MLELPYEKPILEIYNLSENIDVITSSPESNQLITDDDYPPGVYGPIS